MNIETKDYDNDYELLYLVGESNEDANEAIIRKYSPAIDYIVRKYGPLVEGKGIDNNDLYQEGLIGLDSAIRNYQDHKDIKFSTFAFTCIKRRVFSAIKKANRKKNSVLNESYSIDYTNDDDKSLESVIKANDSGIEDLLVSKEQETLYNEKVNKELTKFEKQVYDLRINGFSYEQIANTLGKTVKSIDSSLCRIRIKIRQILEEIN